MRKIVLRVIFIALLFSVAVGGVFSFSVWRDGQKTEVVFFDVGQGDSILISQGGNQILIDGGRSGKGLLSRISRFVPFWDRTIEVVITTHPDSDHIGGLPELFSRYRVGTYVSTEARSDSDAFLLLEKSVREARVPVERLIASRGLAFAFPNGGRLEVLYPEDGKRTPKESNEGSIVTRFSFGDTDFLLTGDLPREEVFIPDVPPSEVLKLAHHGSKYSSSEAFLSRVHPEEAVVSVGKNSYGHPAPEVLDRVAAAGALIRRTDVSGDIVYRCLPEGNRCAFVER